MKWCFLLNHIDILMEFAGKVAAEAQRRGDECILVSNSRIAEYTKRPLFPSSARLISKVDWCIGNAVFGPDQVEGISWKDFFPSFDRKRPHLRFEYEHTVALISQLYHFLDEVFERERPDVVINEPPANVFTIVAQRLCQARGIPYLGLIGSRFSGRFDVYDRGYTCGQYEEGFRTIRGPEDVTQEEREAAEGFVSRFVLHEEVPAYLPPGIPSVWTRFVAGMQREARRAPHWWRYLAQREQSRDHDYESEAGLRATTVRLFEFMGRNSRISAWKGAFEDPRPTEKYLLFPLHVQPESSTSAQASYFSDQLTTVQNAAFSLPFPWRLYVKEHPQAIGQNSKAFYRRLGEIPNVRLIAPDAEPTHLIANSEGVITLTSTIGLEAALVGKPAYILGEVFYAHHPLCFEVTGFEELRERLASRTTVVAPPDLEAINLRFVISYLRATIPGNIRQANSATDPNDYRQIYEDLVRLFIADGNSAPVNSGGERNPFPRLT